MSLAGFARLAGRRIFATHKHRRTVMRFAEKIGMVYFGSVDHTDDDHRIVRGLTTSPHYRDTHYTIGTYDDYDVAFVERSGSIKMPKGKSEQQQWLVMAVDLKTQTDLPHVFLGKQSHTQAFYLQFLTKFSYMTRIPTGVSEGYDQKFLQFYTLYGRIVDQVAVTELFDPGLCKAIVDHFHELAVEVSDGVVYLYAENSIPTEAVLQSMLCYGVWLAQTIDAKVSRQAV